MNFLGKRFTVLVGLVDDHDPEGCQLLCKLYTKSKTKEPQQLSLILHPGDLVMFNGDKLWHCITPMTSTPGQKRIVLSMEYISDEGMTAWQRVLSNMKDAVAYFGVSALLRGQ